MKDVVDKKRIQIAWQEPSMTQIGKGGVSDNVIEEVKRLLKKHRYMKVRILRNAIGDTNKTELVKLLCQKTGARLDGMRGNTAVIYKTRGMRNIEQ
ncbi:MAG: YhbY family RNA-binding protein [Candidatus Thorarchaeota archaeon]|jgi:RNA-binding protein